MLWLEIDELLILLYLLFIYFSLVLLGCVVMGFCIGFIGLFEIMLVLWYVILEFIGVNVNGFLYLIGLGGILLL